MVALNVAIKGRYRSRRTGWGACGLSLIYSGSLLRRSWCPHDHAATVPRPAVPAPTVTHPREATIAVTKVVPWFPCLPRRRPLWREQGPGRSWLPYWRRLASLRDGEPCSTLYYRESDPRPVPLASAPRGVPLVVPGWHGRLRIKGRTWTASLLRLEELGISRASPWRGPGPQGSGIGCVKVGGSRVALSRDMRIGSSASKIVWLWTQPQNAHHCLRLRQEPG